ncbi:MAG: UvrD-helicase domain-containing protein, partial [Thermoplasmata archaeon]
GEISGILRDIKDRFFHDQIDVNGFRLSSSKPGATIACDAISEYVTELEENLFYDFARVEAEFLGKLRDGELDRFREGLRFVLVDEYQDTNLLQELIYAELATAAIQNGGGATIVGDDDQSLYRFRGATVDLFEAFPTRFAAVLGSTPRTIYLSRNYRSTPHIVDFVNDFVQMDNAYQGGRVPGKPRLAVARTTAYANDPIFGMFRNDVNELSHDLADFVHAIVHSTYSFSVGESRYRIRMNPQGGSPADLALLMSSPRELDSQGRPRLALLLRQELQNRHPPINVFNPRGQNLENIPEVQRLCGLLLECIDPGATVQGNTSLPPAATSIFNIWRHEAQDYARRNPQPRTPIDLGSFVTSWQIRTPLGRSLRGRREVLLTDLIYKLITWVPEMQDDIEGLVYLEAITRTVTQTSLFASFGGEIIFNPRDPGSRTEQSSVRDALWNIFTPLATGAIEINEDLLETLPSDRLNIMSIHQAKGLEFPLVIVDVGSDFRTEHWAHAFKRFPRDGGVPHTQEDMLRPFSPLGPPTRSARDRAFDDLVRQFFVAYSRAQDVLLLVGLNSVRDGIKNVGAGWDRSGTWHWGSGLPNLVPIP